MAAAADLLFVDGAVHPDATPDETVEAIAVRNGTVRRAADTYEVDFLDGIETRRIDLDGRTVVPGFVDAGANLLETGHRLPAGTDDASHETALTGDLNAGTAWTKGQDVPNRPDAVRERLLAALVHARKRGVTTVFDTVTRPTTARVYHELAASKELPVRVRIRYLQPSTDSQQGVDDCRSPLGALRTLGLTRGAGTDMVQIDSVGIDLETYEVPEMSTVIESACEAGLRVAVRAPKRDALESILPVLESHHPEQPAIVLGEGPTVDQIGRLADVGAIVVAGPMLKAAEDLPLGRLIAAGIPLRFGSDGGRMQPLRAIQQATGGSPSSRLGTSEALHAATGSGTIQARPSQPTSLAPGQPADFVVLSGSPWETPASELDVTMTVRNGRLVYEDS